MANTYHSEEVLAAGEALTNDVAEIAAFLDKFWSTDDLRQLRDTLKRALDAADLILEAG